MKKTRMTTKALSMFLSVIMLFTMISVGIVVPEARIDAQAADDAPIEVETIAQLNAAITTANNAGSDKVTTIKLKSTINYSSSLSKLTEITTGNILFDFAGNSILINYAVSGDNSSSNTTAQLPSELAGSSYVGTDYMEKALLTIRSGGKLQMINSATGSPASFQAFADLNDTGRNGEALHQTSSNLIYNEGTLILGDSANSSYNDFILYAKANCRVNGEKEFLQTYGGAKGTSANAYTVTLNGTSVFKMYGGTINASGISRSHRGSSNNLRVYALNIQSCYSAEIYGGSINLPNNNTSIEQSRDKASEGSNCVVSAIRCNAPNVYIFDVDCLATARTGLDSSKNNFITLSCVYSTSKANAVNLYGGNFTYSSNAADNASTAYIKNSTIKGPYNIAINNSLTSYYADGRTDEDTTTNRNETQTKSFVCYTLFIHDGGTAENGINIFEYSTFRDYLSKLSSTLDVYAGASEAASHHNDGNSHTCSTTKYLRNGYKQTGWKGKTHPAGVADASYSNTGAATLNTTSGGSLFLEPVWEENVYTIHYDYNDGGEDSLTKVTDTSTCLTSYMIDSTPEFVLGTPVRPGYRFVNWEVTAYEYPETDTKKPWSLGTYNAGFKFYNTDKQQGRNGELWLKANWSAVDYTATFNYYVDADGDLLSNTQGYTAESTFTFPSIIARPYYDSTGTYKSVVNEGSWQAGNTLYYVDDTSKEGNWGNAVFEAQYTPKVYTISYDINGGTSVDDVDAKTYTYETARSLPSITRKGYTHTGWTVTASYGDESSWKIGDTYTDISKKNGNVELIAQWSPLTYSVHIDLKTDESMNGKVDYVYSFKDGLEINDAIPTRTGYTFLGWRVKSVGEGGDWTVGEKYPVEDKKVYIPGGNVGTVVLEAEWQANGYKIIFNSNNGTYAAPVDYDIEDTIVLPVTTREGYVFSHWLVKSNDGNWFGYKDNNLKYNEAQTLGGMYGDVTLEAQWDVAEYAITLDPNGGQCAQSAISYNINTIPNLPAPTYPGYVFDGWVVDSKESGATWEIGTVYMSQLTNVNSQGNYNYGEMTLKAKWVPAEYNIHFISNGSSVTDIKYTIEKEAFTLSESSLPGHRFIGWKITAADNSTWEAVGNVIPASTVISGRYGDVTLVAEFETIEYTVTFRDIDGTEDVLQYNMKTSVTIPSYEADGYTFNGWMIYIPDGETAETVLADCGGWSASRKYQAGQLEAGGFYGDVILVPDLNATSYELSFIPNGGLPFANISYDIKNESNAVLPASEKTGYTFAGWKATSATGNWVEGKVYPAGTSLTGKYGTATFTAEWTPKSYTIYWDIGNNNVIEGSGIYNEIPVYPGADTPTKEADSQYYYEFDGWSPEVGAVTGETTYTAQWKTTLRSYTVTWKYETSETSGYITDTSVINYGVYPVFNNGENPIKTSPDEDAYVYRFVGWAVADKNGNPTNEYITESTTVSGDVTYIAVFREVLAPKTVNWIINGGKQVTKWEVGETPSYVGVPAKPDANGMKYTFSHWSPEIVKVTGDVNEYTYEAVFIESAQTYEAKFILNGGKYDGATTVQYNKVSGLTMPQPTKAGYIFEGWNITAQGGNWNRGENYNLNSYYGSWGNVTFEAIYSVVSYKITIETDGIKKEKIYSIESTDTIPAEEKDGYVLSGWTIVSANGNWVAGDTVAADMVLTGMYGDITVIPVWTAKTYKITWVSGDTVQEVEFRFGENVVAYPPLAKAGFTAQWDKEVPAVMPAEDLTFTAIYTPIQYYLRFNTAGGSAVENFYYDTTSEGVLATPTRDGATFKGWLVSAGSGSWIKGVTYSGGTALKGTYGNATLTAQWEIEIHTVTWVIDKENSIVKVSKWYHGSMPSFDGTPVKEADEYNSYVFIGWDKAITTVTEDVTYTARYEATERIYTVIWNVDGFTIRQNYKFGETPVYTGSDPIRPSTAEYDFVFSGWSPEVSTVSGDIVYVAQFEVFTKLLGLRVDKSAVFLEIGENAVVSAIISPSTASNKDVEWISADETIATIDAMGKITATGAGDTVIRVQSKDGAFRSYCVVSVAPVITEYIVISAGGVSTTRLPGEAIQLTATVMPENATNKTVRWSSSDTTIATVDATGLVVFGKVEGTAIITAVADGYAVGTIEVRTTTNSDDVEDSVKTYVVMFSASTSEYIIAGNTYESISIIYKEGDTVEFLLAQPHFVMANGMKLERDTDGMFRIRNIDKNYSIMTVERADIGLEEEPSDNEPVKLSFFDKLKQFFRSIVEFFRNLF